LNVNKELNKFTSKYGQIQIYNLCILLVILAVNCLHCGTSIVECDNIKKELHSVLSRKFPQGSFPNIF